MGHVIELSAYVEIQDKLRRGAFISALQRYNIKPAFLDNKIEFRYTGSCDIVTRLMTLCDAESTHSIHVSAVD